MYTVVDVETREPIARFATEEYARTDAMAVSREHCRPLMILSGTARRPIARYLNGEEIEVTAVIHQLAVRR